MPELTAPLDVDAYGNSQTNMKASMEHREGPSVGHPKVKELSNKREIHRLWGATEKQGLTLVPLKLYFNERGRAKVELAIAKGKKTHDKRQTDRDRSWQRDKARLMREKG